MTTVIAHFTVIWCGVLIQHYLTVSKLARSVNLRPLGNPKRGEKQRKSVGIERKLDIINIEKGERIAVILRKKERRRTYRCSIQARLRCHYCFGKAVSVSHSEYVSVAFILSYVARLAVPYFHTLSHKRHDFRGKSY
jgi:hypothetical protein